MTDLLDALFLYANESCSGYAKGEQSRSASWSLKAERLREQLRTLLPEDKQPLFADYLQAESCLQQLELEVMFRAGLSIGLELSRL